MKHLGKKKFSFFLSKILIFLLFIKYILINIIKSRNNSKYPKPFLPKISIFLPIYNKEKYIKKSIKSIQSQTLKDLEIIAINDFSNDGTLKILQSLAKNDSRIKIINNDRNYGLLYSRAIGIKSCNGEYLLNLDPDDVLKGSDNLEILYKYAKKSKIDVVSFGSLYERNKKKIFKCSNFDKIYTQPRIFESAFDSTYNLNDFLLWNKLIKRDIFLKAYEIFKEKIYGEKWNYHEDNIWSILVHKYAKSMKCINKLIYVYNNIPDSLMNKRYSLIELKNIIYRHEMYKTIFSSKNEEKYLFAEYLKIS